LTSSAVRVEARSRGACLRRHPRGARWSTASDGEELLEDNVEAWAADVDGRGKRVIGDRLRPADDATTVRVRNGELLVTDGPFTETKDWIVGFDILDCEDLDEAIEIASAHPMARALTCPPGAVRGQLQGVS
jgi:hypothetical protein